MIELNLQDNKLLEFNLDISGATDPVSEIRFTISKDNKTKISLSGVLSKGVCKVDMSSIDDYLESREYPCFLEVFIASHIFQPIVETLKVIKPILVSSTVIPGKIKESVSVVATKQSPQERKPTPIVEKEVIQPVISPAIEVTPDPTPEPPKAEPTPAYIFERKLATRR